MQGLSFIVNFNFCWKNSVSTRLPHNDDDLASLRYLMIMIIIQTNSSNTNTYLLIQEITLPASSYLPSKKPTGAPSFIQWHRPCVKWCCEIHNQYFKTIYNDGDHCRSCVERLQSNFVLVWFLHFFEFMISIYYEKMSKKWRWNLCLKRKNFTECRWWNYNQ